MLPNDILDAVFQPIRQLGHALVSLIGHGTLPCGRLARLPRSFRWIFGVCVHLDRERLIPVHSNQYLCFFETLLIGLYLLRGEGDKIFFAQAAHKKSAKHAAVTAFRDGAVKL